MIRRVLILIFAGAIALTAARAQNVSFRKVSDEVRQFFVHTPDLQPFSDYYFSRAVTSVVVQITDKDSFSSSLLIAGEDTFQLREDIHYEGPGSNSVQIIFKEAASSVRLYLPDVANGYSIFGISAPRLNQPERLHRRLRPLQEGCEEPPMVSQSEWREGLPAPSYSRSFTTTEHLIVHHSATSNTLTDYYNVVRNIYLYHTQVNGWSDIGYNYLVAPDGTVFKGRDPGEGAQDLVLGAHFCGRNSSTMGICVLGNYSTVEPSEASLQSLEDLLNWKAFKDGLDVLQEKNHPLNPALPVIAGHRQGCATECPGEELFARLDNLRQAVAVEMEICSDPLVTDSILLYPNPTYTDLQVEIPAGTALDHISIISLSGQLQHLNYWDEGNNGFKALVSHLKPGVYIVRIKLKNMDPQYKKVILL